ncbi:GerMN domain-containing protein [Paenarthrobacter sp. JL.01a]|uniref:GerMN domain-containing protein n=1 Tax=Paenarthrobacter sp. JL.01a TaxID=2979324 RepID=UPI0021C7A698|nr:GerMN domain-containing protein [Paenarthrobacter sp. JL.01a]UXM91448.1 GerMN domain-containing protein [Paenarthrobacter sp. JL.01a]
MRTGRGIKSTTAIAAACLAFGAWVAGCTTVPDAAPLPTLNSPPTVSVPSLASPSLAASSPAIPSPAAPSVPAAGVPSVAVPAGPPPSPSAVPAPSPASSGTAVPRATQPVPVVEPSPEPGTSAAEPSATAPELDADGPAVYYVAIDDGGARGVRFGCNDSLVPVRGVSVPGDPLSVALGRLLEAGLPVDSDAALYDSLAGSSLRFLSGYMNGSTVVVNLSGSLRPSGVCDIPRIQAQLIHTVVSATGASRAEIYVNGRTLTEALSVR